MPTRSPGNAGSIVELGLPERAVSALLRAGVTGVDELAALSRSDLVAIRGLGPGSVAAIRRVVPEPALREGPAAPEMPSFESLRSPRRRSAVDLLVPERSVPPPAEPAAVATLPEESRAATAARPPDTDDLLRLGRHVVRVAVGVPGRIVRWSVQAPARCLHGLLGG